VIDPVCDLQLGPALADDPQPVEDEAGREQRAREATV
jgi:hypothetical protein